MWGLSHKAVVSRNARYNYGHAWTLVYDSAKHDIEDKYWDTSEGQYRARDQMGWLLKWVCMIQQQGPMRPSNTISRLKSGLGRINR